MPPATIIETTDITTFCQKLKFPARKARNNKMKASQQTPTITVPASLEPTEFMSTIIPKDFIPFSYRACHSTRVRVMRKEDASRSCVL